MCLYKKIENYSNELLIHGLSMFKVNC